MAIPYGRESEENKNVARNQDVKYGTQAARADVLGMGDERIDLAKEAGPLNGESTKETAKHKEPMVSFLRLFSLADKFDYVLMFFGTIGAAVHGAALPIFFWIFGKLLNSLGFESNYVRGTVAEQVDKYAIYFVYLGLACWGSSWLEVSFWMHTGERQSARLRAKYLQALLRQDVAYLDTDINTGDFVNSIATDPLLVQDAISEKVGNFIHYVATFVSGMAVGFGNQWRIALVTLAVVPFIAAAGGFFAVALTGTAAQASAAYAEAGSIAEQAITQVRTVYSFVGETKFVNDYSAALHKTQKLAAKAGMAKGVGVGGTYAVLFSAWALLFWYGGVLVRKGTASGGEAFSTIFSVIVGSLSLGQAMPNVSVFAKGRVAFYKIFKTIEHEPSINKYNDSAETLESVEGFIELRNVDFSYPSRPDMPIFKKFSLVIPPGKTVAIVGNSGSGKSTVISLIERFYDPTAGEVLLDGHDLRKLDLKWLRGQIGLVNQEPALFATTIAANILYGKDIGSQEEIEAAAKAANASSFIEKLPLGYQTQVGERGAQLSGGQKQRVAIARAMLKNPTVLLLDEATSALDAGSEQVVQEALDRLMVGRTTIVVAHRLSTIRNADSIAVVQDGQIVERGTHQELHSRENGAYGALVRLQQLATTTGGGMKRSSFRTSQPERLSPGGGGYYNAGGSPILSILRGGSIRSVSPEWSGPGYNPQNQDLGQQPNGSWTRLLALMTQNDWTLQPERLPPGGGGYCSAGESHSLSVIRGGSTRSFNSEWSGPGYNPQKQDLRQQPNGSWTRLLAITKNDWIFSVGGTIGSMMAGSINPCFALIISSVLAEYYNTTNLHHAKMKISVYCLVFVGLGVACPFIYILQHYSLAVLGEKLVKRVRETMFSTILRNEMGWFDQDENNSSQIAARLASDSTTVRAAIGERLSVILQNVTLLLVACILSLILQWKMALVVISTLPILTLAAVGENMFLAGFAGDVAKAHARATQVAGEAVANIRTVAAFNAEDKVQTLFADELSAPAKRSFLRGQIAGFGVGLTQLLMYLSYGLALWYAGRLVSAGEAKFGNVLKVFFIIGVTAFGMAETFALAPDLARGGQAVASVFLVLDRVTAIEPEDHQGVKADKIKGDVELKHVSFAYPSRPDVPVFKNLSLKVRSGNSLALVGASGSGKSSVIALMERFYDPLSGQVLIDGKDIKQYNLKSVRQHIALVQQEPALFSTTIYENILYGKAGASEAEVIEAAKVANAHKFISSLPEGYKTEVGERGVQLSGGQKQRVAIARAVLKDPAILLLDEATSALDAESEKIVQAALDRLLSGRTTVIVAHRLSTIKGANSIAVVQDGTILEKGSHSHLLARNGAYSRLINLQNSQR